MRAAQVGGAQGGANSFSPSQRIENPVLRTARIDVAKIGLESSDLNTAILENNLVASIKARYFEGLKHRVKARAGS